VKKVDTPAQSVFMVLFLIGAIVHLKIFQGNRRRGHNFLPTLFIFGKTMRRFDVAHF
jgi:type II secretory pathway component PulF